MKEKIMKKWLMSVAFHCIRDETKKRSDVDERRKILDPHYLRKIISARL